MESLKSFLIKSIISGFIMGAASAAAPDLSSYQYKSRYLAEYSIFKIDVQYIGLHVSKKYQNANEIIQDSSNKVLKLSHNTIIQNGKVPKFKLDLNSYI